MAHYQLLSPFGTDHSTAFDIRFEADSQPHAEAFAQAIANLRARSVNLVARGDATVLATKTAAGTFTTTESALTGISSVTP